MGNCCPREETEPTKPAQCTGPHPGKVQAQEPNQVKLSNEPRGKSTSHLSNEAGERSSRAITHTFQANHEESRHQQARKPNIKGVPHVTLLHAFPYTAMKAATHNFDDRNLIGRGGFGDVYRGWINLHTMTAAQPGERCMVAVKKLQKESPQGQREWETELSFLGQLNHPNVVKLIRYCSHAKQRILVYEYMARGTLESRLTKVGDSGLSWRRRMRIAIGTAQGLAYLHTAVNIIHRDVKSSNILLNSKFGPKLSDFGLAKHGPQADRSQLTTRVLGTRGYFAPEYIMTGHLTLMTDVYSFGVVLLEIISGSGAVKRDTSGLVIDLVSWAKLLLGNNSELHHVLDKRLRGKIHIEEASEYMKIILKCLHSNPKSWPTILEVLKALKKLEQSRKDPN